MEKSKKIELIAKLRKETGAGIGLCKEALEKSDWDYERALKYVSIKLQEKGASKSAKAAHSGIIQTYVHGTDKKIGVMLELTCQTDFVARTDDFQYLAKELALQIAAMNPLYISEEDIPESELQAVREQFLNDESLKGKPDNIKEKIVEGRIKKWKKQVVLEDQEYFRDDSMTVRQLIDKYVGKLGETIRLARFARWVVGQS